MGSPLYFLNRGLFYDYVALTKQSFGVIITTMTYWWGPTTIRISGDASVAGQIKKTEDGRAEFTFPERMVMTANHQIYTDWLYLWWVGYANSPNTHGYIYIILKESLKYIPVIGTGMMFYGFIFMSRKMAVDQPRMAHRLRKLSEAHTDPSGKTYYNPMWLLLFPEGTNISANGRTKSAAWADKMGYKDPEHVLLPRSTGMYFCLSELQGSVDYVYDCTVAYEGVPYVFHLSFRHVHETNKIGAADMARTASACRAPTLRARRPSRSTSTGGGSRCRRSRWRLPRSLTSGCVTAGTKRMP